MPLFSPPASGQPRGGSRRAIAPATRRGGVSPRGAIDRSCFLVVAAAVRASAPHEIGEELRLDGALFVRQLESRSQRLVAATRLRIKKPRAPSSRTVAFFNDPVSFPNRDNIRHHVYSFSSPKKFELPLYIGTPAAPVLFDKPGVVALGSNIHDWMLAYIYVVTTPYFAKTAADGKGRLDGLAPGTYEARVWQPRMRGGTDKTAQPVTLAAGELAQVAFVVSLKAEWRVPRAPDSYKGAQGS